MMFEHLFSLLLLFIPVSFLQMIVDATNLVAFSI